MGGAVWRCAGKGEEAGLGGGNGPQIEAANEEEEAQGLPGKSVLSGAEPLTA